MSTLNAATGLSCAMWSAGQSDPKAKCLSQVEEVYTHALHFTVSGGNDRHPNDLWPFRQNPVYVFKNVSTRFPWFSVFRNGDLLCPPFRFIVPRSMRQDLEQILGLITEKVSLRTGAVRRSVTHQRTDTGTCERSITRKRLCSSRLCTLDGATVSSAAELETGRYYVAVGTERLKKLPYVELLVSKDTERYCC